MQRLPRRLIFGGLSMFCAGVLAYVTLFFGYDSFRSAHTNYYILLLCVVFIGYLGLPVFLTGLFLFSFKTNKKVKVTVWILLLLVVSAFVPLPEQCNYSGDVGYCRSILPYESSYWNFAFKKLTFQEDNTKWGDVRWNSWGNFMILDQGFLDIFEEIKEQMQPMPVLHECYSHPEKCPFSKADLLLAIEEHGFTNASEEDINPELYDKYGRWSWRFFRQVPDEQCFSTNKRAEALKMDPVSGEVSGLVNRCVVYPVH